MLLPFLISRSLILGAGILLQWLLDTGRIYRYAFIGNAPLAPLSATFDANWYGMIATSGYSASANVLQPQNYHFFPLYPLLMRLTGDLTGMGSLSGGYFLAGMILSHIFFLGALILLYKLTMQVWDNPTWARRTVWLICALPWAYVFSMTYAELLLLLLTCGAFLIGYNNRVQPTTLAVAAASILTTLATLTRPQGFVLAIAIAWLVAVAPPALAMGRRLRLALLSLVPPFLGGLGFVFYIALHTQSSNLLAILTDYLGTGIGMVSDLSRLFILPPTNPVWYVDVQATLTLALWLLLTVGLLVQILRFYRGESLMFMHSTLSSNASAALAIFAVGSLLVTLAGNPMNIGWGRYMLLSFPIVWLLVSRQPRQVSFDRMLKVSLGAQVVFMFAVVTLQFTP